MGNHQKPTGLRDPWEDMKKIALFARGAAGAARRKACFAADWTIGKLFPHPKVQNIARVVFKIIAVELVARRFGTFAYVLTRNRRKLRPYAEVSAMAARSAVRLWFISTRENYEWNQIEETANYLTATSRLEQTMTKMLQ